MIYFVIILVSIIVGAVIAFWAMIRIVIKPTFEQLKKTKKVSSKHLDLYLLMNDWVNLKQDNKKLETYFINSNYKKIAIYGMNYVGETLLHELKNSSVEVLYAIDKNADNISSEIKVIKPGENMEAVDAIVVTPISFFDDIAENLEQYVSCPIISIEDIVFEAK